MSIPSFRIFANLQELVVTSDTFLLDSATKGLLDTNKLSGFTETEITVPIQSLTISRGRSRQLDRFTSGSASITFLNSGRELDPLNTGSALTALLEPRVRLSVEANGVRIYSGLVTDWDIEYDKSGQDVATVFLSDAFTSLATAEFADDITPSAELPGERLQWVVDEVGYFGDVDFDDGIATLGAYQVQAGTKALDYMFAVEKSDRGFLFIAADGTLDFVYRFGRRQTTAVTFSDSGVGFPYQTLNTQYGDELLFNEIMVSSPAGSVSKSDATSISTYGLNSLSLTNLLNSSLVDLNDLASGYLARFKDPQLRFTGLSLQLSGLSDADATTVLSLDLISEITVVKSFDVGSPSSVSQTLIVSGIRHRVSPGSHIVEFVLEDSPFGEYFTLDDVIYGILDNSSVLG